jgi:iron-sulfur cluster repair protein YtfE (RIC family)
VPFGNHEVYIVDAIALLKADHVNVKELLARLDATTERAKVARRELFGRIKVELTVHETIEEEIFYPALKQHPRARDIVLEGIEEHNVVDTLLGELTALSPSHETWGAKATVMRENLEHHIEEEETDMFVKARNIFDRAELTALGQRMAARKITARADVKRIAAKREE